MDAPVAARTWLTKASFQACLRGRVSRSEIFWPAFARCSSRHCAQRACRRSTHSSRGSPVVSDFRAYSLAQGLALGVGADGVIRKPALFDAEYKREALKLWLASGRRSRDLPRTVYQWARVEAGPHALLIGLDAPIAGRRVVCPSSRPEVLSSSLHGALSGEHVVLVERSAILDRGAGQEFCLERNRPGKTTTPCMIIFQ